MERLTKMQILAMQELYHCAVAYRHERITERELHTTLRCISFVMSTESWYEGKQAIWNAVQIAGIFSDDTELRKVYKKIMDEVFEC